VVLVVGAWVVVVVGSDARGTQNGSPL
jgi:hypothetical protein